MVNKLVTYGGTGFSSETTQADIELLCFSQDLTESEGGLGRFGHLRNATDLLLNKKAPLMIWNEWSELMLQEFCVNRETIVAGPSACVSGGTRIWNPLTGEFPTIRELQKKQIAPVVMTLDGPEQADIPFVKGVDDLFEIVLASGVRFSVTAAHLVLCPEGYVRVGSLSIGSRLFGYEPILRGSILDTGLLAHARDVHYSQKKAEDFRDDYRRDFYCDDEQLLGAARTGQSFVPLQVDVRERNQSWCGSDGLGFLSGRNLRELRFDHRSNSDSFAQVNPLGNHERFPPCLEIYESSVFSRRRLSQYELKTNPFSPDTELPSDASCKRYQTDLPYCRIHEDVVVSITRTSKETYYDITVPKAEHYFAEGAIHHNSWKSTCAAWYGLACCASDPLQTKVIITSTSLGGLRERIWKDMLKFYRSMSMDFGNVINHPTPKIQTEKGDDSAGIFGVAVEQGDIDKAIDKIKGRHAPNVIVIIDEATGALQAIVDACLNLSTACKRFQLIAIANPCSYFDQHGRLAEPELGWNSVSVNSEKWRTKRGGVCIHLDGRKSPNVLAGFQKYPGMTGKEDLINALKIHGENSPEMWQERYGFWPPEGLSRTILSDTMIEKFKARSKPTWVGKKVTISACDPAFEGGDRKPQGFAEIGEIDDEGTIRTALCFTELLLLQVDVTSKEPIHYQLERQIKENCKARGVEIQHFGLDTTGEGGGLASIIKREWGEGFSEVEFGGAASERPISDINPRKGREEYANKVTELWYQFRLLVENNQIRGMPIEMAEEFCQRHYEMQGNRKIVESKKIMKLRVNRSPDLADMGVVMVETAIKLGLLPREIKLSNERETPKEDWRDFARKMNVESEYEVENA